MEEQTENNSQIADDSIENHAHKTNENHGGDDDVLTDSERCERNENHLPSLANNKPKKRHDFSGIGSNEEPLKERFRKRKEKEENKCIDYSEDEEEEEEDTKGLKKRKGRKKRNVNKSAEKPVKEGGGGGDEEKQGSKPSGGGRRRKKKNAVVEKTPGVSENGAEDKQEDDGLKPRRSHQETKQKCNSKPKGTIFDENGIKIDSNMCHQCQRNDKGRVVRCTKCKTKRFCVPCIQNWSVFLALLVSVICSE